MFKKIKSILRNYIKGDRHWSYSISLAVFVVGTLLFSFSLLKETTSITLLSSCMFVLGIFLLPNFKSSYIDDFAKGTFKFTLSIFGIMLDFILIRDVVNSLLNSKDISVYMYIAISFITFFIARYYIDILYRIITAIINDTNKKSSKVKKVWKITITIFSFLVTLASFAELFISITKMI